MTVTFKTFAGNINLRICRLYIIEKTYTTYEKSTLNTTKIYQLVLGINYLSDDIIQD